MTHLKNNSELAVIHSMLDELPSVDAMQKSLTEELFTVLMRRSMVRITNMVCEYEKCGAIVTGESLGQVASQTAEALVVTDNSVTMPVFRPLIGMDKIEIMDRAMEIGTYEKSIEPYEDCCTVFLPKHPATKPKLDRILESESRLDVEGLVERAVESKETVTIVPGRLPEK